MADFIRDWAWPGFGLFAAGLALYIFAPDILAFVFDRNVKEDEVAK
ncbi:hypothetical protein [Catelliglobosispora koreensis]|nr:hypothetical protein [Catelliglobosispora koreensis]